MRTEGLIKSFILLLISMLLMGLGISLVVHADLGTTAFTAFPLVISHLVPFTLGEVTMVFNILLVIIQIILLGKQFPFVQYFQLLISIGLGLSIDFSAMIVDQIPLPNYFMQLLLTLIGCLVIALSILVQLEADIVNNPGEGIVRAIVIRFDTTFDRVKMPFDLSLVIIAVIISLLTMGQVVGVREGTLISAFLVGYYIRIIQGYRKRYQEKKEAY